MITLFGFELTAKLGPSIAIRERNQQMLAAEKAPIESTLSHVEGADVWCPHCQQD